MALATHRRRRHPRRAHRAGPRRRPPRLHLLHQLREGEEPAARRSTRSPRRRSTGSSCTARSRVRGPVVRARRGSAATRTSPPARAPSQIGAWASPQREPVASRARPRRAGRRGRGTLRRRAGPPTAVLGWLAARADRRSSSGRAARAASTTASATPAPRTASLDDRAPRALSVSARRRVGRSASSARPPGSSPRSSPRRRPARARRDRRCARRPSPTCRGRRPSG